MLSVLDASRYLRGLLVLIRRDERISEMERNLVMRVGKSLGFEGAFCANAIHEILDNSFIDDSPPLFSTKDLAMAFIKDGITVACSDDEASDSEVQWLRSTAESNGISLWWFHQELANVVKTKDKIHGLESERFVIMNC